MIRQISTFFAIGLLSLLPLGSQAQDLTIADAHIHYSHDAWEIFPPARAVEILRDANIRKAFVSSSSDDGTQMLYEEAPDLIVPVLRPYRRRGETRSWLHDPTVLDHVRSRLEVNEYAGIGEFHAYGEDINGDVMQGIIALARQYDLFLHAHSDAEAVHLIFKHFPEARVLWAHSGFDSPDEIRAVLEQYDTLWADLAFRSDHASGSAVDEDWQKLFEDFPDRFMLGTDTYTPERWPYIAANADWSREWLATLPPELAANIGHRNAEALLTASNSQ
ncbi:amidohydrolase [Roseibium polysiphoniae]|uniref:Amidohydrolase n=1 Tax=Roseibium polysiphoniae TaxID=2571221 RepID=A0A944GQ94_9HYPH|nr:amidohydrolase family protein [Roseibium polysiphoniae]MBS8258622.1 amidohydrolase [Roseibium polysiphoniae]